MGQRHRPVSNFVPASISRIVNGRFFGGSVSLPFLVGASGPVFAQVVAWDASVSTNYWTAISSPRTANGQSGIFSAILTSSAIPLPPATMTNFASFAVWGTATPPGPLSTTLSGTNILFQWPPASAVTLEKCANLANPEWKVFTGNTAPGSATDSPGTNSAFYRLVSINF
jgi:hypothetical protein